jgi:hypothetical protein
VIEFDQILPHHAQAPGETNSLSFPAHTTRMVFLQR